jgi:hypothetical protein
MTPDEIFRLSEGSDFPAIAGPRSDHHLLPAAVTALRASLRRIGVSLPGLGAGRHDLLQPRPLLFGGDDHSDGRHLRGPP